MTGRRILVVVIALVAVIVIAVAAGLLVLWAINQPVSIAENSVLEITLSGGVTETPPTSPWVELFQPGAQNLFELRRALQRAADDEMHLCHRLFPPRRVGIPHTDAENHYVASCHKLGV